MRTCRDPVDMAPERIDVMLQVSLVCLVATSLYLGTRWLGARSQVADLQRRVAALKRQLGQRR